MEVVITNQNFEAEVIKSDIPVMVDFYADWCVPCKMAAPLVHELAQEYEGRCKVGKCNIDDDMELAQKFKVLSVPTFILFKDGKQQESIIGAVGKQEFQKKINNLL